jgi:hypothetical protein
VEVNVYMILMLIAFGVVLFVGDPDLWDLIIEYLSGQCSVGSE